MASKTSNAGGEKTTCRFVRAWQLNLRCWKLWMEQVPGYFVSSLFSSVCTALTPYVTLVLSAQIISELAGGRDPQRLLFWAVLTVVVTALLALLGGALRQWNGFEQGRVATERFKPLADKITTLDYAEIDRQELYDLYAQIRQNDTWRGLGFSESLRYFPDLCKAVVQILGGIGFTLTLFLTDVPADSPMAFLNNPLSMLLVLGAMVAAVLISSMCSSKSAMMMIQRAAMCREANRYANFYGVMALDDKRAADLRIYCQQEKVCRHYMDEFEAHYTRFGPLARLPRGKMGLLAGLSQAISALLTCFVYLFVCLKSWGGAFDVGSVTRYVGSATQLFGGMTLLLKTLGNIRANGEFLELTFQFLDLPNHMYQGSLTTEKRADRNYQVEFRDVSFRYPGSDFWALRHVNVKFRIGSRLAVVGPNGSGKTTFIKLLCRLYDPTEGTILLNGIDIRKYRYQDYIALFSVVFQDFRLLSLPLGENVAGSAACDRDRVERCLQDAGFGPRLKTMPKGLDTFLYKKLDKDGVEISGGEAQKIAIARALYKDAPFIVLDEPTAALDPIAEADIYSKFDAIAGDKTAIYISHRLSSCKFCDEIAVFDHGAIIQTGSHETLVADETGLYHQLWQAQAQYYTKES